MKNQQLHFDFMDVILLHCGHLYFTVVTFIALWSPTYLRIKWM